MSPGSRPSHLPNPLQSKAPTSARPSPATTSTLPSSFMRSKLEWRLAMMEWAVEPRRVLSDLMPKRTLSRQHFAPGAFAIRFDESQQIAPRNPRVECREEEPAQVFDEP